MDEDMVGPLPISGAAGAKKISGLSGLKGLSAGEENIVGSTKPKEGVDELAE